MHFTINELYFLETEKNCKTIALNYLRDLLNSVQERMEANVLIHMRCALQKLKA